MCRSRIARRPSPECPGRCRSEPSGLYRARGVDTSLPSLHRRVPSINYLVIARTIGERANVRRGRRACEPRVTPVWAAFSSPNVTGPVAFVPAQAAGKPAHCSANLRTRPCLAACREANPFPEMNMHNSSAQLRFRSGARLLRSYLQTRIRSLSGREAQGRLSLPRRA